MNLGCRIMIFLFTLVFFLNSYSFGENYNEMENCYLSQKRISEIRSYQPTVNKIIKAVLTGEYQNSTYKHLADFVDKFGNRLTGTDNLEDSIDYIIEKSKQYGLQNVRTEEVIVPYWIR